MSMLQGANFALEHATAQHDVGTVARNAEGQEAVYVQADDAITAKHPVVTDAAIAGSGTAANAPFVVTGSSAVAEKVVGIAPIAVTAGYYFWAITKGVVTLVPTAAGTAIDDALVTTAVAGTVGTLPSTAVNPAKTDFDALAAAVHGVRMKAVTAVAAGTSTVLCY